LLVDFYTVKPSSCTVAVIPLVDALSDEASIPQPESSQAQFSFLMRVVRRFGSRFSR